MPWKCSDHGHTWEVGIFQRTSHGGRGCPFCAGQKVWVGFNDLESQFPEVAAEADGWDPKSVTPGSSRQKRKWKCQKCLKAWKASPKSRTSSESGCPRCSASGFNPGKSTWFYLMKRDDEQQIGITNFINDRLKTHRAEGWTLIEKTGPHPGQEV